MKFIQNKDKTKEDTMIPGAALLLATFLVSTVQEYNRTIAARNINKEVVKAILMDNSAKLESILNNTNNQQILQHPEIQNTFSIKLSSIAIQKKSFACLKSLIEKKYMINESEIQYLELLLTTSDTPNSLEHRQISTILELIYSNQSSMSRVGKNPITVQDLMQTDAWKLQKAICDNQLATVKYILSKPNFNPNAITINGSTPMSMAIAQFNPDIVEALLFHGGKVSASDVEKARIWTAIAAESIEKHFSERESDITPIQNIAENNAIKIYHTIFAHYKSDKSEE